MTTTIGECVFVAWYDEAGLTHRLEVKQADPIIEISGEILRKLENPSQPWARLLDGVLTIDADNRRVVYRLTEYDAGRDVYRAEWPD